MKIVPIRQALQHVADNPELNTDEIIALPAYELIARTLFEIANGGQASQRGSLTRANVARTMIFDRLGGRRKAGSHPATRKTDAIEFVDLTGKAAE